MLSGCSPGSPYSDKLFFSAITVPLINWNPCPDRDRNLVSFSPIIAHRRALCKHLFYFFIIFYSRKSARITLLTEIPSRVRSQARCVPVKMHRFVFLQNPAVYGMDLPFQTSPQTPPSRSLVSSSKAEKHKFFHGILPGKNFLIPHGSFPVLRTLSDTKIDLPCSSTGGFRITMPRKARTPDNPSFSSSRYCGSMRSPALHNWKSHTGKSRILRGFPPFWHTFRVLCPHPADPVSAPQTGFPGSTIRL